MKDGKIAFFVISTLYSCRETFFISALLTAQTLLHRLTEVIVLIFRPGRLAILCSQLVESWPCRGHSRALDYCAGDQGSIPAQGERCSRLAKASEIYKSLMATAKTGKDNFTHSLKVDSVCCQRWVLCFVEGIA